MAITIRHDAAAGLVGAYGAGQAAGRRRGQKYLLDSLARKQQHEQRLEEIAARNRLHGARRGGAPEGVWLPPEPMAVGGGGAEVDPEGGIMVPTYKAPGSTVEGRAKIKANERARRLGKPIPYPEVMPRFKPRAELEREAEFAADEREREREVAEAEAGRDFDREMAEGTAGIAAAKNRYADVRKALSEGRYAPEVEEPLRKALDTYVKTATSLTVPPEEREKIMAEQEKKIAELRDETTPEPTFDDELNETFGGPENVQTLKDRGFLFRRNKDGEIELIDPPDTGTSDKDKALKEKEDFMVPRVNEYIEKMKDQEYQGEDKPESFSEAYDKAEEDWKREQAVRMRVRGAGTETGEGGPSREGPGFTPEITEEERRRLETPRPEPVTPKGSGAPPEAAQPSGGMEGGTPEEIAQSPYAMPPEAAGTPDIPEDTLKQVNELLGKHGVQLAPPTKTTQTQPSREDAGFFPLGKESTPATDVMRGFASVDSESADIIRSAMGKPPSKMSPQEREKVKVALQAYREYKLQLQQEQAEQTRQQEDRGLLEGGTPRGGWHGDRPVYR